MANTRKFYLSLNCDNEAFSDNPAEEVARILAVAAEKVREGRTQGVLFDFNGNSVGAFRWQQDLA